MTTTAGKWFEIDSRKGQVYLVGAATRELAFEYHDKGYIALEANLGFEDGKTISFLQGGNTVTATDDENGFSEDNIGKYIYTGDGWHKILSVSDVTIVGCGKNLLPPRLAQTVAGVTYTPQSNGTYIANGTCMGTSTFEILPSCVLPPGKYALSGGNGGISLILAVYDAQCGWLENLATSRNGVAAIVQIEALSGNEAYHRVIFQGPSGAEVNNVVLSPQLEVGDTATAFEPYEDIPFLALDNAQGQIESVAVEAGCRARQAGTGDPSPSNIRAITGRASVEIAACGKNLLPVRSDSATSQGITYTSNGGGSYTVNGTAIAVNVYDIWKNAPLNGTYTLSGGQDGVMFILSVNDENGWVSNVAISQNGRYATTTVTSLPNGQYYRLLLQVNPNVTVNNVRVFPQIERSDTFTGYEPYRPMGGGAVAPTEPLYGLPGAEDTVEVSVDGDVTVTRNTAALELDGTENWTISENTSAGVHRFVTSNITPAPMLTGDNAVVPGNLCSHYNFISADETRLGNMGVSFASNAANLHICDMDYASVDAWKSYLAAQATAGTPVTIVYELAAPTTETPADIDPIEPNTGDVNVFTDADSLNITLYKTENNKYASVTGSFSQTQNGFTSMLAQMNEISISGEDVELTKLEIDYVPQVR